MLAKLKAFFKLVRWFHELLAILPFLSLFLVIGFFSKRNGLNCELPGFNFMILCVCVQSLIAAGCVLNDIMDRDIDKINKPKTHVVGNAISLRAAWLIFFSITAVAIVLSVYISCCLFAEWAWISSGVYILSILYDVYLKRSPLLGNILMALLSAFIPLVIFFFAKDCIRALHNEKIGLLIWLYAGFPFLIIIPRELSLDISDMEGDKANGCKTLPIVIGAAKSKWVVAAFLLLTILLSVPLAFAFRHLAACLAFIDILLLFYIYLLRRTNTRTGYIRIGRFLWFIMISGLIGFTVATLF